MITRIIKIGDQEVPFKASAAIPRLYRAKFRRDIFKDMLQLESELKKADDQNFPIELLDIFEAVAYIMAKHADSNVPATPEEWLEQFNMLDIYVVLPELLEMWGLNVETQVESKKKFAQVSGS